MKTIRQSVIIFAVTSLPFLLTAQTSGGSSSSSSSGSRTTTQPSSITSQSGSASGTIDRENSLPVQTTGSKNSPGSSGQLSNQPGTSIERIDKDTLDVQLTAKDLIDKDVYDRNEKKIGKVVDVVLTGQGGPLAHAFVDNANGKVSSTPGENPSQPAVVIAHGGAFGMGKDLFRAPVAQLNYDSNLKHLKLNVSENDLSAMTSSDASTKMETSRR